MVELPEGVGLVVDLDDTLYGERSFHESGFRWVAAHLGFDPAGPEVRLAAAALRAPAGRPLDVLSRAWGLGVDELLTLHREHPPDIALHPDARRLLDRATAAGIPMVLLTDGRSTTQRHKIEALGITSLFRAVLISEEVGATKHTLPAFRTAAANLGDRDHVTSLGDNPAKDVLHPLTLGWSVLLLADRGDNVHPQHLGALAGRTGLTVLTDLDAVSFAGGHPPLHRDTLPVPNVPHSD